VTAPTPVPGIEQTLAEVLAALIRPMATARFDEYGPHDARGAAIWDVAAFLAEDPRVAAAIAHLLPVGTTTTEWGVRRQSVVETQYRGPDGWTTGKYDRTEALRLSRSGGQYRGAVTREHTTYADQVTEWRPVEDGDA
jgi:hypothetical protein